MQNRIALPSSLAEAGHSHRSRRDDGRVHRHANREAGFTIIEFMIAMAITTAVLGATVGLAAQIQQAYTADLDDVAVEQEVRYALDWVARYVRSAGSNPYACAPFQAVWADPDGDGEDDD